MDDIVRNGRTYRYLRGYYMATRAPRTYLHRDIYEEAYGPIPPGMHVHHVDHDTLNNDPRNLRAVDPVLHAQLHYAARTPRAYVCDHCGEEFMSRKGTRDIRWCSPRCKEAARRTAGLVKPRLRHPAPLVLHDCAECGSPFESTKPWAAYCSPACRGRAGRRNRARQDA